MLLFIPGFIINWITFPDVIVHELGHKLVCHLTKTDVFEVCYFRFGNPSGYVIHEKPDNVWKHILIGFGPLITNSILGFTLGLVATRPFWEQGGTKFFGGLLFWLAVSIAMHSFPSSGDAKSIWEALWGEKAPILARLVGTPLVGIIYLGAVGSIFWLDLVYGLGVAWGLPRYLLK